MPVASTLLEFATVSDTAAATTKKLVKQRVLAEYFSALGDDDDLRRAVRFAGGRIFPVTQDRNIGVGGALLSEVALSILKVDPHVYSNAILKSGEIGEGLGKLWPGSPSPLGGGGRGEGKNVQMRTGEISQ